MRIWPLHSEQSEAPAILAAAAEDDADEQAAARQRLLREAHRHAGTHATDGPTETGQRRIGGAR